MLGNEETRKLLLQKLKDGGHVEKDIGPKGPRTGRSPLPNPQMDNGMWPAVPLQFPYAPFPPSSYWLGPVASPWSAGASNSYPSPISAWTLGQPGSSRTQGQEVEAENAVKMT